MAITNYGLNDSLAVKLWSKTLDHEALKFTDIGPLIGRDPGSIIQLKDETSKGDGDQITFGIRMQMQGAGFTENQLAEGNGESLTTYSDKITINELGHVAGVKSKNTIDQQRVPFDLREEARMGLSDWWAKRYSVAFFNQVCGFTLQVDVRYTGLNAVLAPSATRIIRQSSRASDDLLVAGDTFTLDLIDKAKETAITATPKIRPVNIVGRTNGRRDYNKTLTDKYVMYLHPFQVTDMRRNTATGQWLDIEKAASMGRGENGNKIYSGAIGEYNGVIMRQSYDVTNGVSAGGVLVPTVNRAVLLGGQACMMAFGRGGSLSRYRWNEELFDHKRRLEVSAWSIHGLKKTSYNNVDYGTVVVSTYSVQHT